MVWWKHPILVCVVACIIPNIGGFLGSLFTDTSRGSWYDKLEKPQFNPPTWLFLPMWTIIYVMIGFASFRVWFKGGGFTGKTKIPLAFFAAQLILNWLWTPIFFGLQALGFALIEISVLWIVIAVTIFLFFRVDYIAGTFMVLYIGWITFAAVLNFYLWNLNR